MKTNILVAQEKVQLIFSAFVFLLCTLIVYFAADVNNRIQNSYNADFFQSSKHPKLIITFRNDDLTAGSDFEHENSILSIFSRYGIKQTFAFIPKRKSNIDFLKNPDGNYKPMVDALKKWQKEGKIEIALHGFTHLKSDRTIGEFSGLPFEEQIRRIQEGKRIIKQILDIDVSVFVPPFNQADNNTLKACKQSGINIYSGFWGQNPIEGFEQVNVNAVLFKNKKENYQGYHGKPSAEEIIRDYKRTPGTKFCNIFYHSRTDFNDPMRMVYLDNLLNKVIIDPDIVITSIEDIPLTYSQDLTAYSNANILVGNIFRSMRYAKLYLFFVNVIQKPFVDKPEIKELSQKAIDLYFNGNYKKACINSIRVIDLINQTMFLGRFFFYAFLVVGLLLYLLVLKRNNKRNAFMPFNIYELFLLFSPLGIGFLLNVLHLLSGVRLSDLNILLIIYVLGILSSIALYSMIKIISNSQRVCQQ